MTPNVGDTSVFSVALEIADYSEFFFSAKLRILLF